MEEPYRSFRSLQNPQLREKKPVYFVYENKKKYPDSNFSPSITALLFPSPLKKVEMPKSL